MLRDVRGDLMSEETVVETTSVTVAETAVVPPVEPPRKTVKTPYTVTTAVPTWFQTCMIPHRKSPSLPQMRTNKADLKWTQFMNCRGVISIEKEGGGGIRSPVSFFLWFMWGDHSGSRLIQKQPPKL